MTTTLSLENRATRTLAGRLARHIDSAGLYGHSLNRYREIARDTKAISREDLEHMRLTAKTALRELDHAIEVADRIAKRDARVSA